MRVLITGSTGFVGRHLVAHLVALGHDVVVLGRAAPNDVVEHVRFDLSADQKLVLPGGIDSIVHLAQSANYRHFPSRSEDVFNVNTRATLTLLNAATAADVSHVCVVSTGTVYEPYRGALVEDIALAPTSFLGVTKLMSEMIAGCFQAHVDLEVLRLFAPYGPGQVDRLVPELIRRVRNGIAVDVAEDGHGMRITPTYVTDIVSTITTSIENRWIGTYNLASREVLSIRQMAEAIGGALGKPPTFNVSPGGSTAAVVPDLAKIRKKLDLDAFTSFREGIATMVNSTVVLPQA